MIQCEPDPDRGSMLITGLTPNGIGLVTRTQTGASPVVLRGGALTIATGGIALTDTEAPIGIPVEYVVTVSDITSADRLVQQNLIKTPTFLHGVGSWVAGTGRTLTTPADPTAHSAAAVGLASTPSSTTSAGAVPTLVGRKSSAIGVSGSYVLDPATPDGGSGAIATDDWMLIVHSQLSSISAPATPSGWTLVDDSSLAGYRQIIWKRKRAGGDTSYTVAAASGASSVGSLLWVRSAGDVHSVSTTAGPVELDVSDTLTTNWHSSIRPARVVSTFTSVGGTYASVSGGTEAYSIGSGSRYFAVASNSQANAGDTTPVTATYAAGLETGFASQIAFQNADSLVNRVIATVKADTIPANTSLTPHLLTGRFRWLNPGVWNWQDVKDAGTWQDVKDIGTWLDVRGSSAALPGDLARMFVTIVNPATGADYIQPQQVITVLEGGMGQWHDVAMLFTTTAPIPTTAEIRLVHGSALKEFQTSWYLDEWGLTPGAQRADHDTLFWFDGDSALPANHAEMMYGTGWTANNATGAITWVGTVGNSVSEFRTATSVRNSSICELDMPSVVPCEPVLLSDPVNVGMFLWVSLVGIDDLTREATRSLHKVLNAKYPVAVSSARAAEATTITVETGSLQERDAMNQLLDSGRVLLLRNPDPAYPESSWYLSIGGTKERRPIPDARYPERLWSLPVARVERPAGLIEMAAGRTWADVLAEGTWADVLAGNDDWLDVLDTDD